MVTSSPLHTAVCALVLGLLLLGSGWPRGSVPAPSPVHGAFRLAPPDTVDDPRPRLEPQKLEREIHDRINEVRASHRLSRLQWVDSLQVLAEVHNRDMAARDFFAHTNPSGETVNDRAEALGLVCYRALSDTAFAKGFGENLYRAHRYGEYEERYRQGELVERVYDWKTPPELVRDVVTGWMNSPSHRENLLTPSYDSEAIDVYLHGEVVFVTQVLC